MHCCASACLDTPMDRAANSEAAIIPVGIGMSDANTASNRCVACLSRLAALIMLNASALNAGQTLEVGPNTTRALSFRISSPTR
jgi:hypothetical protein